MYIFYGSTTGAQTEKTDNLFTYETPDNEIWININPAIKYENIFLKYVTIAA